MSLVWIKSLVMFKVLCNLSLLKPNTTAVAASQAAGNSGWRSPAVSTFCSLLCRCRHRAFLGGAIPLELWAFLVNFSRSGLWQRGLMTPVSCILFSVSPWPLWSFLPRAGLVPAVPPQAPSLRHCHRRLLLSESSHKMTKKPETSELIHSLL